MGVSDAYYQKVTDVNNRISEIDRESGMIRDAMRLPEVQRNSELRSACDRQLNELRMERDKLTPLSLFWQRLYHIIPGA